MERRLPGPAGGDGVAVEMATANAAERFDELDVLRVVDPLQIGAVDGRGLEAHQVEAGCFETTHDGGHARRSLGMAGTRRVVL